MASMRTQLSAVRTIALGTVLSLLAHCTHGGGEASDVDNLARKPAALPRGRRAGAPQAAPATPPPPVEPCQAFEEPLTTPPLWLPDAGIVVTRLVKQCVTRDGREGYLKNTPWMAMGLPCTGGGGKIDVGGNYYAPKIASLILSTDCPMSPPSLGAVAELGARLLPLAPQAKLLAYNPLAVQYWELPGLPDANVGFTVDLRSVEATQRVWRDFVERKPLPVRLYGRENAWVMGHNFYFVSAELVHTASQTFKLNVKSVEALTEEGVAAVKARCEALRPRRNCQQVFN